MTNMESNEQTWLAWIEGELDPEATRAFEDELQSNPALSTRLYAMRRDRQQLAALPEPEPPVELEKQVEAALARPMLVAPVRHVPGRFRRRQHLADIRSHLRRHMRLAAMVALCFGLLAVLAIYNPLAGVFTMSGDDTGHVPSGNLNELIAAGQRGVQQGVETATVEISERSDPVSPEPLAVVLESDTDTLPMLRRLALFADATLVRNASHADLLETNVESSSTPSAPSKAVEPVQPSTILGDAKWTPSFDDQFRYAGAGATYTIVVPLSRLEALLLALDELAESGAAVLLLEDHLSQGASPAWMQAIRARESVSSWTRTEADPLVTIPIFVQR